MKFVNGDVLVTDFDFICPFCGKEAGTVANPPAVVHVEPVCVTFERLDPTSYLREVRKAYVRAN